MGQLLYARRLDFLAAPFVRYLVPAALMMSPEGQGGPSALRGIPPDELPGVRDLRRYGFRLSVDIPVRLQHSDPVRVLDDEDGVRIRAEYRFHGVDQLTLQTRDLVSTRFHDVNFTSRGAPSL